MQERKYYCWDEHKWLKNKSEYGECYEKGHTLSIYLIDEKGEVIKEIEYYKGKDRS